MNQDEVQIITKMYVDGTDVKKGMHTYGYIWLCVFGVTSLNLSFSNLPHQKYIEYKKKFIYHFSKSILNVFVEVECYEDNVDFYENDIEVLVTQSPKMCQKKCQKNIECHYWTFKKLSDDQEFNCWLKRANEFKVPNSRKISGPKYCGKE